MEDGNKHTDGPRPISAGELDAIAQGRLIEIPHWEEGRTMWVRIGYVDFTPMIASAVSDGAFPNALRGKVDQAFGQGPPAEALDLANLGPEKSERLVRLMQEICRAALRDPSYADLERRGLALTVSQQVAVFGEVMGELKGLEGFRELTADAAHSDDGAGAPRPAQ